MKAIVYAKYGTPEVLRLQEVEKPVSKDSEVLLKIHTATTSSFSGRKGEPYFRQIVNRFHKTNKYTGDGAG